MTPIMRETGSGQQIRCFGDALWVWGTTFKETKELCVRLNAALDKTKCRTRAQLTLPRKETLEIWGIRDLPTIVLLPEMQDEEPVVFWKGSYDPPPEVFDLIETVLLASEARLQAALDEQKRQLDEERRLAPKTVEDAVVRLLVELSDEQKSIVRNTAREDLIGFHMSWGMGIRNAWVYSNTELYEDARRRGCGCADAVSAMIIEEVWSRLRTG